MSVYGNGESHNEFLDGEASDSEFSFSYITRFYIVAIYPATK
jgi:hypothetical protein